MLRNKSEQQEEKGMSQSARTIKFSGSSPESILVDGGNWTVEETGERIVLVLRSPDGDQAYLFASYEHNHTWTFALTAYSQDDPFPDWENKIVSNPVEDEYHDYPVALEVNPPHGTIVFRE